MFNMLNNINIIISICAKNTYFWQKDLQGFRMKTQLRPLVTNDPSKPITQHQNEQKNHECHYETSYVWRFTLKLSEPGDSGFLFLTKQSLFYMWTADGQKPRRNI